MNEKYAQLLIGRESSSAILEEAYHSERPRLVAVIGRRRIGKTYLVRTVFEDRLAFAVTGIARASLQTQLEGFGFQLEEWFGKGEDRDTTSWLRALATLTRCIDASLAKDAARRVVFFDELPWLASRRSGFLAAFSWFWNSWAVNRRVTVVICGSAAAWMIRKVVRDKGGLHNRITDRITLRPFTLSEANAFCDHKGVPADDYQRLQLYTTLGGVPFYLDQLRPGESAIKSIDRLLFGAEAPLAREFELLYASLFENPELHVAIVRLLAEKQSGITRRQVVTQLGATSGGHVTRALEELELSGFIQRAFPFDGRKRDILYWLTDEFTAFHLKYLGDLKALTSTFASLSKSPSYKSWAAHAFERACRKHAPQVAKALGIGGIAYQVKTFRRVASETAGGVQVDLLLDRDDRVVTLCEVKFSQSDFVLSKEYAQELQEKRRRFQSHSKTRKHVSLVIVTTYGVVGPPSIVGLLDGVVTLQDFFN